MTEALLSLTVLGVTLGALLGLAARYLSVKESPLKAELTDMMPGTNCGQCGQPGCAAAADALIGGQAEVTLCPPGGRALAAELAKKLGIVVDLSAMEEHEPLIAFVNEDRCIGCTRCLRECPTDALVGGPKSMHTVIRPLCTGCEACVEVCPTDCIDMLPVEKTLRNWYWPKPASNQQSGNIAA
ncbi:MAG: RnfABCDGE type electron transport complex subunit B [Rhodospirillales bacterium]|nr:RnfABCDGE type electron transport complex subunit B [Rhodospirillales bacterium]MCW8862585.1 RnfABCDGE type electron transport complex subunit B [Rhodospirillales bacterium]MCW9001627.1 RnfABCDGE type electron transport complex subunit B [Rhodospirillales bacterium]